MPNIRGTITNNVGAPIPNVSIILTSNGVVPVASLTDVNGNYTIAFPPPGSYKLTALFTPTNYLSERFIEILVGANADITENFIIKAVLGEPSNRYLYLKYFQYIFLAFIGWLFIDKLIAGKLPELTIDTLNNDVISRGTITYLVAVTTISMAALLMLTAIMTGGRDLERRFTLGKDILTLLIGILGTIIGFYYGTTNDTEGQGSSTDSTNTETSSPARQGTTDGSTQTSVIQLKDIKIAPAPQIGKPFTLNANLVGGTKPFTYSIRFTPSGFIQPINDKKSEEGKISENINAPGISPPGDTLTYIIEGADNKEVRFVKKGNLKLTQ